MRRGEMQAVSVKGSGTWALRLGEVAGDNLPDEGRQAGGLGILGPVLHVQALLLARPQDAALRCLQGKRESLRGDLGPWAPWHGWERNKVLPHQTKMWVPRRPSGNPQREGSLGDRIAKSPMGRYSVCPLPREGGPLGGQRSKPKPTAHSQTSQGSTERWGLQSSSRPRWVMTPLLQQRSPQS